MSSLPKRYSARPFPPYAHLPGQSVHPNKPGGHQEKDGEPKADQQNAQELFCYGIDLFNYGYFWEAHVYFEAIWHFEQRKGPSADFLKALIKLCAAALKARMGSQEASKGHVLRAIELLEKPDALYSYRGLEIQKEDLLGEGLDELKFFLR